MKIALILPVPPGYSETFFRSKIKGLQAYGHEVVLVTGPTEEKFESCEHQIHPKVYKSVFRQLLEFITVGLKLLPYLRTVLRYAKFERQEGKSLKHTIRNIYINATLLQLKVDWLHFGFATMAVDRELVAKAIGAKMAVSFRGYDINVFPLKTPFVYSLLWTQVTKVHSISNDLIKKAFNLGLSKQIPYQIITPAIDLKTLPRLSSNCKTPFLKIVTIARLHYIKGIDILLETAALLNKKNIHFTWDIIGSGDKKAEEQYLYQSYRLDLKNNIRFLGKLNHMDTLQELQQADLYVQTSLTEGFCNAVLEAQGLGKLTIAFAKGGLPENIVDGETGFLVPKMSPLALANKIEDVINLPDELKKKVTEQAVKRVKQTFALEEQAKAFYQFYTT